MSLHVVAEPPGAAAREPASAPTPFAWVAPDHPWHAAVQSLREAIGTAAATAAGRRVQAELKGVCAADGTWRLERAYWSVQRRDARLPHGLHADTLAADWREARAPSLEWLRLPYDPYLPGMQDPLGAMPGVSIEILRYVPLRRITFRRQDAAGRRSIGKFKRRSRYGQAWTLLGTVSAALERRVHERGSPGFVVAAPLGVHPARALYFQTDLAGDDLAERLAPRNAAAWLQALGRRQQRLQGLDTRGLPAGSPLEQLKHARSDLAWIAWFRPELADVLRPLADAVEAMPPWRQEDGAFCHGDLVCSQCLVPGDDPLDPEPWAITDFDLCHRGDPCRDLAILVASLDEDVPLLADDRAPACVDVEALGEAILDGARAEAAREGRAAPDALRLRWQRLCAELYYLGLMLKKDRYRPALFERRLARAQRLAGARAWW
jgi:hypothetical protein